MDVQRTWTLPDVLRKQALKTDVDREFLAPEKMAENDNNRTRSHRTKIRGAGSNKSIDHCIIGAICSRESRSGNALTTWNGEFGWGDCHGGTCYGFGLMQIDRRYHSKKGKWDSQH